LRRRRDARGDGQRRAIEEVTPGDRHPGIVSARVGEAIR
jgi:hypothetical protein